MNCDFLAQALDRWIGPARTSTCEAKLSVAGRFNTGAPIPSPKNRNVRKSLSLESKLGQLFPKLRHLPDDFFHVASDPLLDFEAL